MFLNSRSFAPLLGAAMLALAGCQVAPQQPPDMLAAPLTEQQASTPGQTVPAPQTSDQTAAGAPAAPEPSTSGAPAAAEHPVNSHVAFFIGQTHSEPSLTAVKMTDGTRLYLQREPVLKGEDITQAHDLVDKGGRHFVGLRFTKEGARKLADVSVRNKGKRLVLILNGKAEADPVIHEPLDHGVLAFMYPSAQGAASLAARIRGEQPPELKFKGQEAAQGKGQDEIEPTRADPDPGPEPKAESKPRAEPKHKIEPRHKVEPKRKVQPRRKVEPRHEAKRKTAAKPKHPAKPKAVVKKEKEQPAGGANP